MERKSARVGELLNRREFMTRAALIVGTAAVLTSMSRRLPMHPFKRNLDIRSSAGSIFTPRIGSRLGYWRTKLSRFRLR